MGVIDVLNLIASWRTLQAGGAMYKTFKTVEELIEFVNDQENIKTLDSGEVTLKDWIELGNSAESRLFQNNLLQVHKRRLHISRS